MPDPHRHPVVGPRHPGQLVGQRSPHRQRVVADGPEPLPDAGEQRRPVVGDLRRPPVHDFGGLSDVGPEMGGQPLVTQAHAEQGDVEVGDRGLRQPEIALPTRMSRSRRDDDRIRTEAGELVRPQLVVAHDPRSLPEDRADELEEIERERVVVVNQQHVHGGPPMVGPPGSHPRRSRGAPPTRTFVELQVAAAASFPNPVEQALHLGDERRLPSLVFGLDRAAASTSAPQNGHAGSPGPTNRADLRTRGQRPLPLRPASLRPAVTPARDRGCRTWLSRLASGVTLGRLTWTPVAARRRLICRTTGSRRRR